MSDLQSGQAEGPSAGTLLRRAREAAGLHVATLAVALKVPVRKLEALEADRHDLLPDAVFARALASSVCRHLKIDAQPVLQRLPQGPVPRLAADGAGLNTPFRVPGERAGPQWAAPLMRPVGLAVAALLVGAVVVALVPLPGRQAQSPSPDSSPVSRAEPTMPPGSPATVTLAAAEPAGAGASAPATSAPVRPAILETGATQPAPAPTPAAAASAAAVPVLAAAAASAPSVAAPAAPATGVVVFRARAPSWVQVTDAQGNAVLRRLLETGESAGASGALPLSVVVGSAESTEVQVRGKPFSLAPITRDNVARFEVK